MIGSATRRWPRRPTTTPALRGSWPSGAVSTCSRPTSAAALVDARAALEKAERAGDPPCSPWRSRRLGQAETWAAEITPGLLERGAEIEERLGLVLEYCESPRYPLRRLLMRLGEIDRASRASSRSWRRRRRRGATRAPG